MKNRKLWLSSPLIWGLIALPLLISPHPVQAQEGIVVTHLPDNSHSPVGDARPDAIKVTLPAPVLASVPPPAADSASRLPAVNSPSNAPAAGKPRPVRDILAFGGDLYLGGTNAGGVRARNNDGVWAGFGSAYPSLLSMNWQRDEVRGMRVSIGVGDMFTGRGTALRQPVEATYQFPAAGDGTMTIGKFYVPFATQEWEYESKYGMMFQKTKGALSYTGSFNYNYNRQSPNVYLRVGRQFGTRTTLGLSAGGGRGVFSDTSHAVAMGLDAAHDFGGVQFTMEYNLAAGPKGPFQFMYGKMTLTRFGRFVPYVGAYYWHDTAKELGQFQSFLVGTNYRLTQHLNIEGGYARGNTRNVFWLQSHVTF